VVAVADGSVLVKANSVERVAKASREIPASFLFATSPRKIVLILFVTQYKNVIFHPDSIAKKMGCSTISHYHRSKYAVIQFA
jgi:hypothetical protein